MKYQALAAVSLLTVSGISSLAQSTVLYQNTTSKTGQQYAPPLGTEFGNQIILAGGTNSYFQLTSFAFEYNSGSASGASVGSALINLYANDGPIFNHVAGSDEPGTLLGSINLTGLPATGAAGKVASIVLSPGRIVPANFTWTVTFSSSIGASLGLGADTYSPPTVGLVYNDVWQNSTSGWDLLSTINGVTVASFGAEFTGTPVPTSTLASLNISVTATNKVLITWPAVLTSYTLQQSSSLSSKNWVVVTNTPVNVAAQNQVILPVSGNRFFRLASQ